MFGPRWPPSKRASVSFSTRCRIVRWLDGSNLTSVSSALHDFIFSSIFCLALAATILLFFSSGGATPDDDAADDAAAAAAAALLVAGMTATKNLKREENAHKLGQKASGGLVFWWVGCVGHSNTLHLTFSPDLPHVGAGCMHAAGKLQRKKQSAYLHLA